MLEARIHDDVLGLLTRDKSTFCYQGKVQIDSREVGISLTPAERFDAKRVDIATALTRAPGVVSQLSAYAAMAIEHATREMLPEANGEWLLEDEEPISEEKFRNGLRLTELMFGEDGSVVFWIHDTEDCFGGHFIEVGLDRDDRRINVDLMG